VEYSTKRNKLGDGKSRDLCPEPGQVEKYAKLSQEELGFRSGLHRSTIGNLESRKHSPTFKNIVKLAKALDVGVEELLAAPEKR
jgi:transcriptional regulator with XRE-family HTH domain